LNSVLSSLRNVDNWSAIGDCCFCVSTCAYEVCGVKDVGVAV
jgi:hypothetical protein